MPVDRLTPVHEAAHLQDDLRRAGIEPWGWIINGSLAAAQTSHPLLRLRASAEASQIARVRDGLAARYAVVPMRVEEPVGRHRLITLFQNSVNEQPEGDRSVRI